MAQPTVVVVEGGGDAGNSPPPPAPQYVTSGELDARLELMRGQLQESVSAAVSTAFQAQATAEAAEEAALTAAAVAADAAAQVDEAAEDGAGADDVDNEGQGEPAGNDGPVELAPQPPPRRQPAPVQRSGGGRPRRSYGASWLTGR